MQKTRSIRALAAATVIAGCTAISGADAADVDFSGKTITIVVGFGAGGGYDAYGRLAADHLGRFLPGSPTIVVENMPGGGGQRSAVYMATAAPADGTTITVIPASIAFERVRGGLSEEIDPTAFGIIGRLTSIVESELTWHTSETKTFEDAQKRETPVASDGARGNASTVLRVLNSRFGTKFKLIEGYKGTAEMALAMERGEVEGMIHPLQTLEAKHLDWVAEDKVNFLWQQAKERHPDYPDIPAIVEFATNDEELALLSLLTSQGAIGRSLSAPPGTPAEVVTAYREAFESMIQDPDFIDDAAKRKLPLDPAGGAQVQENIRAVLDSPPGAIEDLSAILAEASE